MKPCPFCGKEVEIDDDETLYPTGTGWEINTAGYKTYKSFRNVPREQWCWSMHCPETHGGCGVEMSADTKEEAIEKWNKRV